jgi:hypothetical protein
MRRFALIALLASRPGGGQVYELADGQVLTETVNPGEGWHWYRIAVESAESVTGREYNLLVLLDSASITYSALGFAELAAFDIVVANGSLPLDGQTRGPGPVAPSGILRAAKPNAVLPALSCCGWSPPGDPPQHLPATRPDARRAQHSRRPACR